MNEQRLMEAAESGARETVQALLAGGAAVNHASDSGETALMRAASQGHLDTVSVLLDAGADVNAQRNDGFTALSRAAFFGHAEVVKLLLERGADAGAKDRLGATALNWASSKGYPEIVRILKSAKPAAAAERPARSAATAPVIAPGNTQQQPAALHKGLDETVTVVSRRRPMTAVVGSSDIGGNSAGGTVTSLPEKGFWRTAALATLATLLISGVVGYAITQGVVRSLPETQPAPLVSDTEAQAQPDAAAVTVAPDEAAPAPQPVQQQPLADERETVNQPDDQPVTSLPAEAAPIAKRDEAVAKAEKKADKADKKDDKKTAREEKRDADAKSSSAKAKAGRDDRPVKSTSAQQVKIVREQRDDGDDEPSPSSRKARDERKDDPPAPRAVTSREATPRYEPPAPQRVDPPSSPAASPKKKVIRWP